MNGKISIGTWAYTLGPYENDPIALDVVARKLGELNFEGIELGGFQPHAHPDLYPTKESRNELLKMLNGHGLEVSSYVPDVWGFPFAEGDPEVNKQYDEMFERCIEMTVDLKAPSIRVDTVNLTPWPENLDMGDARKRVVEKFRWCTEKAADAGIFVTWEFEPGFIFNKPSDIVGITKDVGHSAFGIELDTCHAHMVAAIGAKQPGEKELLPEGALGLIKALDGHINHAHIIDSDGTLHHDDTSTHTPCGDGDLDFNVLIPAIREAGYNGPWWTIDLCFWENAWDVTEKCKNFVDALDL